VTVTWMPGGIEITIMLGALISIYILGYRHGRRSERIKQLEDKAKEK